MAGSNRKFRYTSDDGEDYAINRDESNTEVLNGTTAIPSDVGSLPDGYVTRYALLRSTTTGKQRKIVVLTPDIFAALDGGSDYTLQVVGDADGETFRVSSLIGEKRQGLFIDDSGDTDGDNDPVAP